MAETKKTEAAAAAAPPEAACLTLRQKLGDYGDLIKTVRNVGYRLEGKAHEQ